MKGSRVVASVLVLLMAAGPCSPAMAEPILYTIEFVASGTVGGVPFTDEPLVVAGATDLDTVVALANANAAQLEQLITALSYVAGLGFGVAAIAKFKAHKDNPNQLAVTVEVSFPSPLTKLVVRDGAVVTLVIDSIRNNSVEFRTQHSAGKL